jgi:hypothetical protein
MKRYAEMLAFIFASYAGRVVKQVWYMGHLCGVCRHVFHLNSAAHVYKFFI